MIGAIITIGDEILSGETLNTNATDISKKLRSIGVNIKYHITIPDFESDIINVLDFLYNKVDVFITTGGMGPTLDDLTKETICKYIDKDLFLNEKAKASIDAFFSKYNKKPSESVYKQAMFPKNSIVLDNQVGTAPGVIIEDNNKVFCCLPGPPKENKSMLEIGLIDFLKEKSDKRYIEETVNVFSLGESTVESIIRPIYDSYPSFGIATYVKSDRVCIKISKLSKSFNEDSKKLNEIIKIINNKLSNYEIIVGKDEKLELLFKYLIDQKYSISFAESCTGGLLAKTITDFSGVSTIFDRSLVTYSNQSKIDLLGVSPKTLQNHGAVSSEVSREMALGLFNLSNSKICVAITGIAGPGGGSEDKPVGLVYITLKIDDSIDTYEKHFLGSRAEIRRLVMEFVFITIKNKLYIAL